MIQDLLNAGGDITIPYQDEPYIIDSALLPVSGSRITIEPGVRMVGVPGGNYLWILRSVEDVTITANGCELRQSGATFSSIIGVFGTNSVVIDGFKIFDAQKDCIYIGLQGDVIPVNTEIRNCALSGAGRNCISVVAATDCRIIGCNVSGAKGAPGSGIDTEANFPGHLDNILISGNEFHHNEKHGVLLSAFSNNVTVERNIIHGNGLTGISASPGGAVFDPERARDGDIIPMTIDAEGWLDAGQYADTLEVGMWIGKGEGDGWPAKMGTDTVGVLAERKCCCFRMSRNFDDKAITTAEPGTFTARVFREWQCSNINMTRNKVFDNGGTQIQVYQAVNVVIDENSVIGDSQGIKVHYANGMLITENVVHGKTGKAATLGVNLRNSYQEIENNVIVNAERCLVIAGDKGTTLGENDMIFCA